jgi:hypothetical protein
MASPARKALEILALAVVLAAGLVGPSRADFDAGVAAHKDGDYAAALAEWMPLAKQGHAHAQYNLGAMYVRGEGVPQDYAQAVYWFERAALQRHARAQYHLGSAYAEGLGVSRDYARAAALFRRAGEQGHMDARYRLGQMYAKGRGIPKDYIRAHVWLALAAEQGSKKAAKSRKLVAERMMQSEIAEAQRLARELKARKGGLSPIQGPGRPRRSPVPFGGGE